MQRKYDYETNSSDFKMVKIYSGFGCYEAYLSSTWSLRRLTLHISSLIVT